MKPVIRTLSAIALFCSTMTSPIFAATTTPGVTPEEKARIEAVVHQYLLRNPEVLVEAMQVLQRKQYEQAEKTVKQTQESVAKFANDLLHQTNDPIAGNPNGKITVVEFFDYQCPHCVDMAPVIAAIIKANPDLRIVFKEFPIRGPMSELAARAALAANKQGKYVPFQHALLTSNKPITQDLIIEIAKSVGLDTNKLQKDMSDSSIQTQLKANLKLAQDLKLFGTPAFFVSKSDAKNSSQINYIPGQVNQTQLQELINKANQ